jgi:membrane protein DedA with SNARE-associated domain
LAADPFPLLEHGLYMGVLLAPFVQEDAAVFGAAAASVSGAGNPVALFAVLVLGITGSDTWKYWAGRLAHLHPWAARMAAKPAVAKARDTVVKRLFLAMLIARFVPGTRIPLYVAAGVFKAPFWTFFVYVVLTAIAYAVLAFSLLHLLGKAAGEAAAHVAAPVAIVVVASLLLAGWVRNRLRRPVTDPVEAPSQS